LIATFGLGMGNVAAFYGLEPAWGAVWVATWVSVADLLIAGIVLLLGSSATAEPKRKRSFGFGRVAARANRPAFRHQ